MRTWLNNKHDNSEGNMCMCPRCRFKRELIDEKDLTPAMMVKRIEIITDWDNRMDELSNNMKKRFPKENE